jgi:hypothetical protein
MEEPKQPEPSWVSSIISPSPFPNNTSTFPKFSQLPMKLQLTIWEIALSDSGRIVTIEAVLDPEADPPSP